MSNSTINVTALDIISLNVLETQLPASIATTLIGIPSLFGSLLLFIAIAKTKSLRSNFYLCLMHTALADTLSSFLNTSIAMKRLVLVLIGQPETTTPLMCSILFWPGPTLFAISISQTITVAMDRLFCLVVPIRYRSFEVKYLQILNAIAWILPAAVLIYSSFAYMSQTPLIASCTLGLIWSMEYTTIFTSMSVILDGIVISFYGVLLPILFVRLYTAKKKGKTIKDVKESVQFGALVTCFLLLGVYATVVLASQFHLIVTNSLDGTTKAKVQTFANTIAMAGPLLTSIVCIARTRDIKEAIAKTIIHSRWTTKVNFILSTNMSVICTKRK